MKIKLSKSQWESFGLKAGWMKKNAFGGGMNDEIENILNEWFATYGDNKKNLWDSLEQFLSDKGYTNVEFQLNKYIYPIIKVNGSIYILDAKGAPFATSLQRARIDAKNDLEKAQNRIKMLDSMV